MTAPLFSIAILVLNQMDMTRQCIQTIRAHSSQHVPILIIDNGSDPAYQEELRGLGDYYLRNETNIGVIPAMNQAWQLLDTPYIMYLHNDLFILEPHFDAKINRILAAIPYVGVAGFGGGHSVDCRGARTSFTSNMINAELYGTRMQQEFVPSVVLDGMCLIVRKELILEIGGIALQYPVHHYYDLDICLESIYRGYKIITINIAINHVGSQTSSQADYTLWLAQYGHTEHTLHGHNQQIFYQKWGHKQSVIVDSYFNYFDVNGQIPMKV
ncbi:glycosyltransferase family 2 protein [Paenibacillus alvei]|uniref:Glycosyltransferase n=1 Tax=Paenibacillus alvei TaxID=44250 RepID=A0AAP6ZYD3_PAEAL|nr:glycosyltransferase [Paenibacillus alvei]MBG9736810.1 hypothetical protein [Paenibacillus alvei]MBG9746966.1 hypothetical protein [Paenibacillus alvei]MCY9581993.1 glycosyltransferase [Paenibacillus alvei]MCY9585891.1 glycosyltransferase [Paenibacillus alvei]NEZ43538.1 glycosyltransferase [Paenibacillus alvei]